MNRQKAEVFLGAVTAFVAARNEPEIDRFKDGIANWGSQWIDVGRAFLPAADILAGALPLANGNTAPLLQLLLDCSDELLWEQSYRKSDNVVGDDMLSGYGFVEVIGSNGPFVSTRSRCGIGVWGPHINYPVHRHQAEEIYLVLAGSATFTVAGRESRRELEDVVLVESMTPHGFRTGDEPLAVFYLWQAGDLRELSSFGE